MNIFNTYTQVEKLTVLQRIWYVRHLFVKVTPLCDIPSHLSPYLLSVTLMGEVRTGWNQFVRSSWSEQTHILFLPSFQIAHCHARARTHTPHLGSSVHTYANLFPLYLHHQLLEFGLKFSRQSWRQIELPLFTQEDKTGSNSGSSLLFV